MTRNYFRVLNNESLSPVHLIEIRPAGSTVGSTIYFTSAGKAVTWDGNDYKPIFLTRSGINEVLGTDTGSVPAVKVTISNVDTQQARILNTTELEHATVTVRAADRRRMDEPLDATIVTIGELRSPVLTETSMTFEVVNIIGQIESLTLPNRLWQPKCNYKYGSQACGVDLSASPNTITTTVISGSRSNYLRLPASVLTEAGSPASPNDYWILGNLSLADGVAATQSRPFHRYKNVGGEHRFYVRYPFLTAPEPGDTVLLQRGCPKTLAACAERQAGGDTANFGGYPHVPYGEGIKPNLVKGIGEPQWQPIWVNP